MRKKIEKRMSEENRGEWRNNGREGGVMIYSHGEDLGKIEDGEKK